MTKAPLLRARLKAGYGTATVLHDLRLDLYPGDCLGLVGSSGAGKSTLVLALLGMLPWRRGWAEGEVLLRGENLLALREREARRIRGKEIAIVPQSATAALNPLLTLAHHFRHAWLAHEPNRTGFAARVRHLLDAVQLPSDRAFLDRKPAQISVGQAQRVTLALALLHRPSLVIADEPTASLDPATQREVLDLLRTLQREEGTSMLFISHDLLSVLKLCNRVAVLHKGHIPTCVPLETLTFESAHPALRTLLRTLPIPLDVLVRYMHGQQESHFATDADVLMQLSGS